jgi:hypothetical protein
MPVVADTGGAAGGMGLDIGSVAGIRAGGSTTFTGTADTGAGTE